MRKKAEKPFASEAEMCARFISGIKEDWTAYPETAGWDVLLVRSSDGFQIGIEAKLKLNINVVNQAIEHGHMYSITSAGPDCRAVLVPSCEENGFSTICGHIGITVIRCHPENRWGNSIFTPALPRLKAGYGEDWFELCPTKRHRLPEYIPDVAAGASAPLQLTEWKINAIKLVIILERRGFVTRADFKHLGIDHRRWLSSEWLRVENGRWVAANLPSLKHQHPRVYSEIEADEAKWFPKEIVAEVKSEAS